MEKLFVRQASSQAEDISIIRKQIEKILDRLGIDQEIPICQEVYSALEGCGEISAESILYMSRNCSGIGELMARLSSERFLNSAGLTKRDAMAVANHVRARLSFENVATELPWFVDECRKLGLLNEEICRLKEAGVYTKRSFIEFMMTKESLEIVSVKKRMEIAVAIGICLPASQVDMDFDSYMTFVFGSEVAGVMKTIGVGDTASLIRMLKNPWRPACLVTVDMAETIAFHFGLKAAFPVVLSSSRDILKMLDEPLGEMIESIVNSKDFPSFVKFIYGKESIDFGLTNLERIKIRNRIERWRANNLPRNKDEIFSFLISNKVNCDDSVAWDIAKKCNDFSELCEWSEKVVGGKLSEEIGELVKIYSGGFYQFLN